MKKSLVTFSLSLSILLNPCAFVYAQQEKRTQPEPNVVVTEPKQTPPVGTNLSPQDEQKPLTNADAIRMVKAGLSDSVIIQAIQTKKTEFDVSVDGLIQLQNAGVSQAVIQAMQLSATAKQQPANTTPSSPAASPNSTVPTPSNSEKQPYVVLVEGEEKHHLPPNAAQTIQTKTKGEDLASIARDETVIGAVATVAIVETGIATMGGMAAGAIPVVGAIGGMVLGGMFRKKPTYTFVTALGGQNSATVLKTNPPKFEVVYGNITGVNPDGFEPVIVKLIPTQNNYRLVSAQQMKDNKVANKFIEERMQTRIVKLGRGHIQIEVVSTLSAGEYAIALRPISQTKAFSLENQDDIAAVGLTRMAWDFSIPGPSVNK